MKDCSRCRHSVENNPAMAGKRWIDTPCAACLMGDVEHDHLQPHENQYFPIVQGRIEDTLKKGGGDDDG